MKASMFNIFFPHEEKMIGFNSFSGEFIVLDMMLYEMFDACQKMNDFDDLEQIHVDFYNFLVQKGLLVQKEIDEVERVKQHAKAIDEDESFFQIHINPTMNCNFKCWYCYETHIKDSKMNPETIDHVLKFVDGVLQSKTQLRKLHLSWFGGEPLLYYKKVIYPILFQTKKKTQERNIEFGSSMTTNGLLLNQEVFDQSIPLGLDFLQITLDGNREKHNKVRFISEERGSYDEIVKNIFLAAKNKVEVNVRINCSKETLETIKEIPLDFSEMDSESRNYIKFDLHKVWQVEEDIDPEIELNRRYFRKMGFFVVSGTLDMIESSCYGDHRNHATINYDGNVFKCTARDFTKENSEGVLMGDGTIKWNEKYEKRMNIKFKNKPCLECRILPICGGGCSQQGLEHEGVDYCVNDFDENKKVQLIKNKFYESLIEE